MGRSVVDRTGQIFGHLTVIEDAGRNRQGAVLWRCLCDCGNQAIVRGSHLIDRGTASCGCARSEHCRTHGLSHTSEHNTWKTMRQRCTNPNSRDWHKYGGRGITICERWDDFANFIADMGPRPPGMSIDRIDNMGNYEPANCRWATYSEQNINRRPFGTAKAVSQ